MTRWTWGKSAVYDPLLWGLAASLALTLCGLLLGGCDLAEGQQQQCLGGLRLLPRVPHYTPAGNRVDHPNWPGLTPELRDQLYAEIDNTPAQNGTKTLSDAPGWIVVVGPPGSLEHEQTLARGWVDYCHSAVYVAWQGPGERAQDLADGTRDGPLLPAYAHELGHVFGGPSANHGGAGCLTCQGAAP